MKHRLLITLALALCVFPANAGRSFNGSTDKITVPGVSNAIDITGTQMSFSCWFLLTAAPSNEIVPCAKWASGNNGGFMFNYNQSGHSGQAGGHIYISTSLNHFHDVYCSNTINLNQWYVLVLAYQNNNSLKVWLGTQGMVTLCGTDNTVGSVGQMVTSGGPLTFGANNAGRTGSVFTQGSVGESAVWNVHLSDGQATALAAGVCPVGGSARRMGLPPPAGYFPLYGASGSSTEPDLSGNLLNGALTGTAPANHPPCMP